MLTDLLKWGGKRPDSPGAAGVRACAAATSRSSPRRHSRSSSPRSRSSSRRCSSTSARSIGTQRRVLRRAPRLQAVHRGSPRRHRSPRRAARSTRCRGRFAPASRTPTPASTACSAGTVFDFLDKAVGAGAGAADRPHAAAGRRGHGLLLHDRPSSARPFTKYEIVDDTLAAPPASSRHRRRASTCLQNRDIIRMFDGLIVSDSFLLKSNTREMLLAEAGRQADAPVDRGC